MLSYELGLIWHLTLCHMLTHWKLSLARPNQLKLMPEGHTTLDNFELITCNLDNLRPCSNVEYNYHFIVEEEEEETEVGRKSPNARPGTNIHLWQFVKELLLQPQTYGNYIHWIDRQKGIFKIVDSVKVATLWGKRKVFFQYFGKKNNFLT